MRYMRIFVLTSLMNILAGIVITRWFRPYRYLLIEEDALVENLTAIFFLLAFVLGLSFFFKLRRRRVHWSLAMLAFVALIGFLDEISFGERLFNLSMPVWGGVQLDAVHDVVELVYKNISPGLILIAGGILASLGAALTLWVFAKNTGGIKPSQVLWSPSFYFVLLFTFFIAAAVLIDLHLFRSRVLFSLEEVFELNAALALFFFSFSLYESARDQAEGPGRTPAEEVKRTEAATSEAAPLTPSARPQGTEMSNG